MMKRIRTLLTGLILFALASSLTAQPNILFIVSEDKGISKAIKNIPGTDFSIVRNLNAELLAPGTHAGRLTVWSESAIKKLGEIYG